MLLLLLLLLREVVDCDDTDGDCKIRWASASSISPSRRARSLAQTFMRVTLADGWIVVDVAGVSFILLRLCSS